MSVVDKVRVKLSKTSMSPKNLDRVVKALTEVLDDMPPLEVLPLGVYDFTPFVPPFTYDDTGQSVWDSSGMCKVIDIRGWGYLTGGGAMALDKKKAAQIQDDFGRWITDRMNAAAAG